MEDHLINILFFCGKQNGAQSWFLIHEARSSSGFSWPPGDPGQIFAVVSRLTFPGDFPRLSTTPGQVLTWNLKADPPAPAPAPAPRHPVSTPERAAAPAPRRSDATTKPRRSPGRRCRSRWWRTPRRRRWRSRSRWRRPWRPCASAKPWFFWEFSGDLVAILTLIVNIFRKNMEKYETHWNTGSFWNVVLKDFVERLDMAIRRVWVQPNFEAKSFGDHGAHGAITCPEPSRYVTIQRKPFCYIHIYIYIYI